MITKDYNCQELSLEDMIEIDGGIFPLLVIGAVLLLSSCIQVNQNNGSGKQINIQHGSGDTTIIKHSDGSVDTITTRH